MPPSEWVQPRRGLRAPRTVRGGRRRSQRLRPRSRHGRAVPRGRVRARSELRVDRGVRAIPDRRGGVFQPVPVRGRSHLLGSTVRARPARRRGLRPAVARAGVRRRAPLCRRARCRRGSRGGAAGLPTPRSGRRTLRDRRLVRRACAVRARAVRRARRVRRRRRVSRRARLHRRRLSPAASTGRARLRARGLRARCPLYRRPLRRASRRRVALRRSMRSGRVLRISDRRRPLRRGRL